MHHSRFRSHPQSHRILAALAAAATLASTSALAADPAARMQQLAADAGCTACHQMAPGAKGPDGQAPIGPSWRAVAAKYKDHKDHKDQKDAVARLTNTVVAGSNPYQPHWKGAVPGLAMPPNAIAITEADARRLVVWILSLQAGKTP